ncbi:MAG: alcohol dehydrogenase catalytic domain-containing protein, partial [Actinobacteria bacterium]|nr:alcohol dehydrogenase catalytic domain-containing protein [Actinomycetota bacterium]
MKASRYYDVDDFRYEDIELGSIGPGEVLLRMGACGVCGTDVHKAVFKTVKTPIVLGHEVSGEIAEVGPGVRDFVAGDRVFVTHHVPCLTCHYCRHGHHTLCRQFIETNIDPGGFSEYIRIPDLNVKHCMYKIPGDMPYEVAALAEPVACCIRGMNLANLQPGDSLLVMGAGPILVSMNCR